MDNKTVFLSTTPFSTVYQWDVKQFFNRKMNSKYRIEKLGKHLIHQTTKIQLSDFPNDTFIILGVSNKIGMFDASTEKGSKIKQKYHIVKNDWIAYNPYRINVGSIGIKTSKLKGEYISPAYVVFSCRDTLIPEYLWLMMKSNFFNSLIKDSTTGSVRQTLHFEKLADIDAPIPSVYEQKKILKTYHEALNKAEKNIQNGNDFCANLLYDIQSMVSELTPETFKKQRRDTIMQIIPFTSTRRWEAEYILKEGRLENIYSSFKYANYCLFDLQKESLFGLSVKASTEMKKGMIPVLRMSNVVNGEIDFSELKYLPKQCAVTPRSQINGF